MFFIAYAFKGQMCVIAGQVKIVSHSSCRTIATFKYFCPLCSIPNLYQANKVGHHQPIIQMVFLWQTNDGPTLNAGWEYFDFQKVWTSERNETYSFEISEGWSGPLAPPPLLVLHMNRFMMLL